MRLNQINQSLKIRRSMYHDWHQELFGSKDAAIKYPPDCRDRRLFKKFWEELQELESERLMIYLEMEG